MCKGTHRNFAKIYATPIWSQQFVTLVVTIRRRFPSTLADRDVDLARRCEFRHMVKYSRERPKQLFSTVASFFAKAQPVVGTGA
jgi:hypothetical protein